MVKVNKNILYFSILFIPKISKGKTIIDKVMFIAKFFNEVMHSNKVFLLNYKNGIYINNSIIVNKVTVKK